jgi:ATP/ADP translocase
METYRHSGSISPFGIILASTAGITAAVVLGVVYSFAMVNIPYLKIHVFLPICLGTLIGLAVSWGAKAGKIRNLFVAAAYGFLCGLIGLYVAWGADLLARVVIPNKLPMDYSAAFSPTVLIDYIQQFYEKGAWGMKGGGNVSGTSLAVLWAVEALIIVGFSTCLAPMAILQHPFCENCNRWTDIKPANRKLSLLDAGENLQSLLSGDLTSLTKFKLAQNDNLYLEVELARCPTCTESNYLTIFQVLQTFDKKGKLKIERKPLLRNMLVTAEELPLVQNAGS